MNRYIGYIACYSWCVVAAFSKILTSDVSQRINPFILTFFVFSLTSLSILIYNIFRLRTIWYRIKENHLIGLILALNFSSFANWGLMIYPLAYLQPALVATLILGVNPIATAIINRLFLNKNSPPELVWSSLALFCVILFLGVHTLNGKNSIQETSKIHVTLSLLFCYTSGVATSVNNVLTKKILDYDFGATDVLCMRFYLTILISGIIGFTTDGVALNQDIAVSIIWTTITFVLAPLVLLQIALKRLDPLKVAIISPLMPVLVIFMQLYVNIEALPRTTIIASICIWLIVFCGSFWSLKNRKETT